MLAMPAAPLQPDQRRQAADVADLGEAVGLVGSGFVAAVDEDLVLMPRSWAGIRS